MNNNIQPTLSTDKNVYLIGEPITFKCILKNIGKQNMMIVPWGRGYTVNWIEIYNLKTQKMRPIKKVIYELKIFPDKNDFILLKPDNSFSIEFNGILKEGEVKDYNRKAHKGLFIDFEDSAILLEDGVGEYIVKAKYEGRKEWREQGFKKFNFTNIFEGILISNEVKLRFCNKGL